MVVGKEVLILSVEREKLKFVFYKQQMAVFSRKDVVKAIFCKSLSLNQSLSQAIPFQVNS